MKSMLEVHVSTDIEFGIKGRGFHTSTFLYQLLKRAVLQHYSLLNIFYK